MDDKNAGNVLFLILIAVALFAALSYAVTQSSRSGGDGVTKDKARLTASEIIQYATNLEQAISRMQLINRCALTQISFQNTTTSDYDFNTSTNCFVFRAEGGGVSTPAIGPDWLDTAKSSQDNYGIMHFSGRSCITDVGSGGASCSADGINNEELIYYVKYIQPDICDQINARLGIAGTLTGANINQTRYLGTFGDGFNVGLSTSGLRSGCFTATGSNGNFPTGTRHFFHVLAVN